LAVVLADGQLHRREIVLSDQAIARVGQLQAELPIRLVVLGNQTTSKQWKTQLQQTFPTCEIQLIDERNSTLEARQRYWEEYPPQGWGRLVPRGLQVPPRPYDDIVAQILVERYLERERHA
jgi:RNase H-fold protein (predicted Holliday junction resolvase)